jgi:RNA polymerase-binding transcription factor DksA
MERKRQLEQLVEQMHANMSLPMSEAYDELSSYDQHPADNATDLYEREKDITLLELLDFELEKINDALARHENGMYGICEVCGRPIEERRLRRLVNTTLCAQCAHTRQQPYRQEESMLSPGMMSDMGETFQVAGYELYEE